MWGCSHVGARRNGAESRLPSPANEYMYLFIQYQCTGYLTCSTFWTKLKKRKTQVNTWECVLFRTFFCRQDNFFSAKLHGLIAIFCKPFAMHVIISYYISYERDEIEKGMNKSWVKADPNWVFTLPLFIFVRTDYERALLCSLPNSSVKYALISP